MFSASAQELLAQQVGTYDESELSKLLLQISAVAKEFAAKRDGLPRTKYQNECEFLVTVLLFSSG
jgi:hypothetical protein